MCRLFGLTAGSKRVKATFWLLEDENSLITQSFSNPDGTGLGTFDQTGTPRVEKQPLAAYKDWKFALEARERRSTTFIAHVRYATTGQISLQNTHPFCQEDRLFAHNGIIGDLEKLEKEVGESYMRQVEGATDSERFFALITRHIDANDGNIGTGIASAARWVAANLPIYSINIILTTPHDLFALCYPDTFKLFVLRRAAGGQHGARHLDHASTTGRIRVRSGDLATTPIVVVATEPMDEHHGWRPLECGELIHIDRELNICSTIVIEHPPAHQLERPPR